MSSLAGFKRTALLLQPPFELGARRALKIEQICFVSNRSDASLEGSFEAYSAGANATSGLAAG
jgi:hypothetical protein